MRRQIRLFCCALVLAGGTGLCGAQAPTGAGQPLWQKLFALVTYVYMNGQVQAGTALADEWMAGSPGSVAQLNAYVVQSLAGVGEKLVAGAGGSTVSWRLAGPANAPGTAKAVAADSDKFAQVRGFKVELTAASGKEVDNAWESVSGGEMIIEVTEVAVTLEQVAALDLRGPLSNLRQPLSDWTNCASSGAVCPLPGGSTAVLTLIGDGGRVVAQFDYTHVLAGTVLGNEIQLLWAGEGAVYRTYLKVVRDAPPAPRLMAVLPRVVVRGRPVAVAGTGLTEKNIPYFDNVPAPAISGLTVQSLPLLGKVTVGFTTVPQVAAVTQVQVTMTNSVGTSAVVTGGR